MTDALRIVLFGGAGKMCRMIASLTSDRDDLCIVGAVESASHPSVGSSLEVLYGLGEGKVYGTASEALKGAKPDCVIDFSHPSAVSANLDALLSLENSWPCIVGGTTGYPLECEEKMNHLAQKTPLLWASNMSLGINLLWEVAAEMAKKLPKSYNIEIIESHHRNKQDAPSGTAVTFAEKLLEARGLGKDALRYGREGLVGARGEDEIGIHAIRGGDIVGEHTILFAGDGELIELRHRASSRETFARGALEAAFAIHKKPARRYTFSQLFQ